MNMTDNMLLLQEKSANHEKGANFIIDSRKKVSITLYNLYWKQSVC